jgi:hypothetical protein
MEMGARSTNMPKQITELLPAKRLKCLALFHGSMLYIIFSQNSVSSQKEFRRVEALRLVVNMSNSNDYSSTILGDVQALHCRWYE